jgi:hypothetical protein
MRFKTKRPQDTIKIARASDKTKPCEQAVLRWKSNKNEQAMRTHHTYSPLCIPLNDPPYLCCLPWVMCETCVLSAFNSNQGDPFQTYFYSPKLSARLEMNWIAKSINRNNRYE